MDQWHAIDEKHEVAAPRVQHLVLGWIDRLLSDLISAFAARDFLAVIDVETDFLAEMRHIFFVVTRDRHGTPVDERIERERRSQGLDLLDYLGHFPVCQRVFAEPVYVVVVAVQYAFPIVEQIPLSWIAQDAILPSMLLKHGDDVFLEHRFAIEYHDSSPLWTSHCPAFREPTRLSNPRPMSISASLRTVADETPTARAMSSYVALGLFSTKRRTIRCLSVICSFEPFNCSLLSDICSFELFICS